MQINKSGSSMVERPLDKRKDIGSTPIRANIIHSIALLYGLLGEYSQWDSSCLLASIV